MKNIITITLAFFILSIGGATDSNNEVLTCELNDLQEYGFSQWSDYNEFVCVNETDNTDFIILADEHKEDLKIGDNMKVELNKHDEIVNYEKLNNN